MHTSLTKVSRKSSKYALKFRQYRHLNATTKLPHFNPFSRLRSPPHLPPSWTNNNKCQMFNDAEKQRTSLVAAAAVAAASIVACNSVEAESDTKKGSLSMAIELIIEKRQPLKGCIKAAPKLLTFPGIYQDFSPLSSTVSWQSCFDFGCT